MYFTETMVRVSSLNAFHTNIYLFKQVIPSSPIHKAETAWLACYIMHQRDFLERTMVCVCVCV